MHSSGTALVTGACGFLGERISKRLLQEGYGVIGLDREITRALEGIQYRALSLPDDGIDALLREAAPELVVHAAGPASVAGSITNPTADFDGSVRVLAHLLDAVRKGAPGARVIALSSAAVYGNPETLPVSEDAATAPLSPYGYHKVMCEALLHEFHAIYGMQTCAMRIFSAYGPGLRRQLLWDICEKASSNSVLHLFGTGGETRDFIHVDDVAQAVAVLARGASFAGEAYNVASGVETTVHEVASALVSMINDGASIEFSGETREGDPLRWRADISRIRTLGFQPERTLSDGLAEYAAWYLDVARQ